MLVWMKQIVEPLFRPLTVGLLLAVVGLACVWSRRYLKLGRWLIAAGLALLVVLSYWPVPALLLCRVGHASAPFDITDPVLSTIGPNESVSIGVLCGGGLSADESLSANSRANSTFMYRFMEGVRIYRLLPNSRLLVSVSRPRNLASATAVLVELADLVGIPPEHVVPIIGASTTADESRLFRDQVGTRPFVLVTSALHMPRSLLLFRQHGMHPIPAPLGVRGLEEKRPFSFSDIYPNAARLTVVDDALHEALGMLWAWVRGPVKALPPGD